MDNVINDSKLQLHIKKLDKSIEGFQGDFSSMTSKYDLNRDQTNAEIIARENISFELKEFLKTPKKQRSNEAIKVILEKLDKLGRILDGKLAIEDRVMSTDSLLIGSEYLNYGQNKAVKSTYVADKTETATQELYKLLDEVNVKYLAQDFMLNFNHTIDKKRFLDLHQVKINKVNSPILFLDSNNKSHIEQGQEFHAYGLMMSNDLESTMSCAALIRKAKNAGLDLKNDIKNSSDNYEPILTLKNISRAEYEIIGRLIVGKIRTSFGSLSIENSFLRLLPNPKSGPEVWAFGSKKNN